MTPALIYLCAVFLANLTATAFIPIPVFGQVAVGTLIFGLTFTQRDRMHHMGRPFVYKVILISALLSTVLLLSVSYGWGRSVAAFLSGLGWGWAGESLEMLADSGPRVLVASFIAIFLSEAANTEVYHRFRHRTWLTRVTRSNAVAIPLDSALFNLIAFAGVFEWSLIAQIVFGEIIVKFAVGGSYALFTPRREKNASLSLQKASSAQVGK
jgi:queuosine precursor transporter